MADTLETVFTNRQVVFDPQDKANNGLYLSFAASAGAPQANALIARLTAAGLWTPEARKAVGEEQKPAYLSQLECVEIIAVGMVYACATDHPKFPLDRERWQAWKQVLQQA